MNKSIAQIYEVGQVAIDADFAAKILDDVRDHRMADYHLVTLLEELGFVRTVAAWREMDKATRT
jgi:hypothetical protein